MNSPNWSGDAQANLGIRVATNATAVLVSRGASLFLAAGALSILARCLDVTSFGTYSLIYAYLALFGWLAGFGLQPFVARECTQNRENALSVIATGSFVCLLTGLGATLFAVMLAPLAQINKSFLPLLLIAATELFLLAPLMMYGVIFQVDLRQWYGSSFNLARSAVWFVLLTVVYLNGGGLVWVVTGRLVAAAAEAFLNWRVALRYLAPPAHLLASVAKRLVASGFPLAFTGLAGLIYLRIDQVMLHRMVGDHTLGHYAAAVRVSELFEALPAALSTSLFPVLCGAIQDLPRFNRYLDIGYRYMVISAVAISMTICIIAPQIISAFYGEKFSDSAPLLAVLIWSEVPIFFSAMLVNGLLATNTHGQLFWSTLAGACVNVALNLYTIPRWDAMGASWATVISYTVAWIIVPLGMRKTRKVFRLGAKNSVLIFIVGICGLTLARWSAASPWVRLPISLAVFLLTLVLFGLVRRDDFKFFIRVPATVADGEGPLQT